MLSEWLVNGKLEQCDWNSAQITKYDEELGRDFITTSSKDIILSPLTFDLQLHVHLFFHFFLFPAFSPVGVGWRDARLIWKKPDLALLGEA